MLYILGIVALALLIYGLILFLKRGNKEFNPKLSLREKVELEKMIEKKVSEQDDEEEAKKETVPDVKDKLTEPIIPKTKSSLPSKEINDEISRFETYVNINNTKVQHSIRSGVQNFTDQAYMVALEEFSLATESNSSDATGFYCRGLTKLQLKNFESAVTDFTEAINLKMTIPNAFYYRALAYYNLNDFDNAILNLKAYINQEKNNSEAYFDLGICLKAKNNPDEAITNFSLAIQRRPAHGMAYLERGLIRQKQNDQEGCCADLKKAFGLGYLEAESYIKEFCNGNSA